MKLCWKLQGLCNVQLEKLKQSLQVKSVHSIQGISENLKILPNTIWNHFFLLWLPYNKALTVISQCQNQCFTQFYLLCAQECYYFSISDIGLV